MYVKFKKLKENDKLRKGGSYLWKVIGIFSTIGGGIYGYTIVKDLIWKPKKLMHISYDDDIVEEAYDIKKKALKKGIELDFDETLNELQKLKNKKEGNL